MLAEVQDNGKLVLRGTQKCDHFIGLRLPVSYDVQSGLRYRNPYNLTTILMSDNASDCCKPSCVCCKQNATKTKEEEEPKKEETRTVQDSSPTLSDRESPVGRWSRHTHYRARLQLYRLRHKPTLGVDGSSALRLSGPFTSSPS